MKKIHNAETLKEYIRKNYVTYRLNADAGNTMDLDEEGQQVLLNAIDRCEVITDKDEIESEILRCDADFNADKEYRFVRASEPSVGLVILVPIAALL